MWHLATVAALLVAAEPSSPGADRANALGFDNGTILVSDGGSYETGVTEWSAWHLTDGDERSGWCSPKGRPTGLSFVWELDAAWKLDAFTVSTRHMQEDGYPGISAKTVELHVDPGTGAFSKVGAFEIGRGQRKEFPLAKGTVARRAKLVVVANHGNAEFTEIAEVELLGERSGPAPRLELAGDFQTNYGPMRLVVDRDKIHGCYGTVDGVAATVDGTLDGRTARVVWRETDGSAVREGAATFVLADGGKRLTGVWYEGGQLAGVWEGPRLAEPAAKCTPARRTRLETLRSEKRLVLYGIRFDTNKDVPRPESNTTLDEVAAFLRDAPAVRLLVEGHTDSTNTPAFNLDLSQRRAQSVVAALAKRGVDAKRLQAKGFGLGRPVADNATAQGRALNRRVEVSLVE